MRISWGYVVGGVVLAGAAVAIYDATSTRTPERPPPVVESTQATAGAAVAAPKPDAHFDKVEITADDHVLGSKDAKVTLVEYASLTCPHCARLNNEVMPRIKKEYVETGKVRYVYRDFPLDQLALAASVLARCAGPDRYFGFVDALFSTQGNWATAQDPSRALEQVGKLGGVTPEQYEACRKDDSIQTKVLEQRLSGEKTFQVNATPTLIVNGDKYAREMTYEELKAVLDQHLSKG
jgi:protein-disulfide isomerase